MRSAAAESRWNHTIVRAELCRPWDHDSSGSELAQVLSSWPGFEGVLCMRLRLCARTAGREFGHDRLCNAAGKPGKQRVDRLGPTAYVLRRETWETYGILDKRLPHFQVDLAYNLMLKRNGCK